VARLIRSKRSGSGLPGLPARSTPARRPGQRIHSERSKLAASVRACGVLWACERKEVCAMGATAGSERERVRRRSKLAVVRLCARARRRRPCAKGKRRAREVTRTAGMRDRAGCARREGSEREGESAGGRRLAT
jgi:hypothetical protein